MNVALFLNSYSQEASLYLEGLVEPSAIINRGTMLYVQGYNNLYQVDTTSPTPTATSIYSPATNFYMSNLTISGSIMYISEENYDADNDVSLGSRIISLDLDNLAAPINVIYTTTQYVSSLAIKDGIIYFSSETDPFDGDNFIVQIYKIDSTAPIPTSTVTLLVDNLSASEQADDMAFYSNNLLISVGGLGKVFGFDTTDTVIEVSEYFDASFNKGLYVNGNILFLTAANSVVTKQLDIASPTISTVALNTIYQDSNNGIPFLANFRDVVLIGDKIYMTLLNQGRVVTVQNESFLNTNSFDLSKISIHNSQSEVIIFGLEDNQKAELYNLSGQLLTTKNVSSIDNLIDISSFSKGVYIIKLENQKIFKFIK